MAESYRRRDFLRTTSASVIGLGAGLGSLGPLWDGARARGADGVVGPDAVRFRPEIEPTVRWIEETPREKAFEVALVKLKGGLPYRDLLAGLFLAGIRNVKPRPVGFKFHAVLVMHSAHLLAEASADDERLLPLFWALDNFKASQARDVQEGDWTLGKPVETGLPKPHQARAEFDRAMESWDSERADLATAALARSAGAAEVMEAFWRYAIRDQRDIGHKAIFAAQCWRTLGTIGWEHAEPALRSLAFGLLDLQGDARPIPVGPYETNLANAKKLREGWSVGTPDPAATRSLLMTLRSADPEAACSEAVGLLNRGVDPGSIWDAANLAASEFLARKPGIVALHAVTACNALHFIYRSAGDDTNRKLALLQAIGWLPAYRDRVRAEADLKGSPGLDGIEPVATTATGDGEISEIFAATGESRSLAAAKALGYLRSGGSPDRLFAAARRLIFHKGRDSHDFKYGAAIWEEARLATDPTWRANLAAAAMHYTPSPSTADSPLMTRAREAVASVFG